MVIVRIGELARRSGVSVRSLRYYEEQGLLVPARNDVGHRVYQPLDVARVAGIQEMFAAGFCSAVIRDLLPEVLDPVRHEPSTVRRKFDEARRRLESEILDIQRELSVLDQLRARLGLAPHTRVRTKTCDHEQNLPTPTAPLDHRDRRLR
jgi:DNA-binding transcriptional MerR regulator